MTEQINGNVTKEEKNEFSIKRVINSPRELVWKVYSEAEHLQHWWGPKGLKMKVCNVDFRPGGMFHYGMETPDGNVMWGKFVYHEIEPIEKIVFVNSFSDEHGNITRAPFPEIGQKWPLEVLNKITFTEENGKTIFEMSGYPINANDDEIKMYNSMHSSMQQGFNGTFDQLEEYLKQIS